MSQIIDYSPIKEILGALKQVLVRGVGEDDIVNSLIVDASGALRSKDGVWTPLGYARYATLSSAINLSSAPTAGIARPTDARYALIQARGQDVNFRDDGVAPTATEGITLIAGDPGFWYSGNLAAIQFIQAVAGASLRVAYYK